MTRLSIIMPVLNEAAGLEATLAALPLGTDEELVVVDGGSDDATVKIARRFTPHVHEGPRGRARQMNFGAARASDDILLFLHADCLLPDGAFAQIRSALSDEGVAAGAFDLRIGARGWGYRLIEGTANLRSRLTNTPFGDQGLFLRREVFEALGGFADLPLMEDIEIARRLRRCGRIVFLSGPMTCSARRWEREGLLYTTLRDWRLAFSYTVLGTPPERLARHYKDVR